MTAIPFKRLLSAGPSLALALVLAFSATLTSPAGAQSAAANEAFADGNRLFREDLYWAALLRYSQAADAGMSGPLLDYNTGVAHYKARQYRRAAASLEKAAASPQLAVLSHYNLGLTAYADGDNATALRWFRRARDQEQSRQISRLAEEAIERIRRDVLFDATDDEEGEEEVVVSTRQLDRDPRPFSELEVYARAGFGGDDNVFRSPAESYVDRSDPANPVAVNPVVQSGSFIPVRLGAKYLINSFEHESFFVRYRGQGEFYSGEELENATEYSNELGIGTEFLKEREHRQNRLFSAFTIAQHEETFFDPDDGESRSVNAVDIGDRYSYLRYGPEIWTRQSWERFSFRAWLKAQLWNYENTEEVPEYDHEFFRGGLYLQYRFTPTSLLRVQGQATQRNFSDRPAFSLDGTQAITNETLQYSYFEGSVLARQRLTGRFWLGVRYDFTARLDQYVGYNDYFRDTFGGELHMGLGSRFDLDLEAAYSIYTFVNAFAYNNPAEDRKTLETLTATARLSYQLPWDLQLVGGYRYADVTSNDARIDYERNRFMLSLEWAYE